LVDSRWPSAAFNVGDGRFAISISEFPTFKQRPPLMDFLKFDPAPLSLRATLGFLSRAQKSSLRFVPGFLDALRRHAEKQGVPA
jgi:DNA (cytosine-5)-methyltransferase 1